MASVLGGAYAYRDRPEVVIAFPNKLTSALSPLVKRMVRTSLGLAVIHVLTVLRYETNVPACTTVSIFPKLYKIQAQTHVFLDTRSMAQFKSSILQMGLRLKIPNAGIELIGDRQKLVINWKNPNERRVMGPNE